MENQRIQSLPNHIPKYKRYLCPALVSSVRIFKIWSFKSDQRLNKHSYCYQPGFLAFPHQQKLIRGQIRNSGKGLLGLLPQHGGMKTSSRFPCLLALWVRVSWFLKWGKSSSVSGVRPEGWLRWFARPYMVLSAAGIHRLLLLLLTPWFCSWLFRSGSWSFFFGLFLTCCPYFAPTAGAHGSF